LENVFPIEDKFVSREEREMRYGQRAKAIWLTGLSGSGKSTLAIALERKLFDKGYSAIVLDGDNIRSGINNNLGFTQEEREENNRRVAEVAKLFLSNGQICIVSFISPTDKMRQMARDIIGKEDYVEAFIDTPIELCEQRDIKGLYKKARMGEISDFTGVDAPYETPLHPHIHIHTENQPVEQSVAELVESILLTIRW